MSSFWGYCTNQLSYSIRMLGEKCRKLRADHLNCCIIKTFNSFNILQKFAWPVDHRYKRTWLWLSTQWLDGGKLTTVVEFKGSKCFRSRNIYLQNKTPSPILAYFCQHFALHSEKNIYDAVATVYTLLQLVMLFSIS